MAAVLTRRARTTTRRWMPWWYHRIVAERVGPPLTSCGGVFRVVNVQCFDLSVHERHLWNGRSAFTGAPLGIVWCDGVEDC